MDYPPSDNIDDSIKAEYSTLVNNHLSSALNPATIGFLPSVKWPYPNTCAKMHKHYLAVLERLLLTHLTSTAHHHTSLIWEELFNPESSLILSPNVEQGWTDLMKQAFCSFFKDLEAASSWTKNIRHGNDFTESLNSMPQDLRANITRMWWMRSIMEEYVLWSGAQLSKVVEYKTLYHWRKVDSLIPIIEISLGQIILYGTKDLLLFYQIGKGEQLIVSIRDFGLNVSDKAVERFIIMYSSYFGHMHNKISYPPYCSILEYLQLGDKIITSMGNDGYTILASTESLWTGVMLRRGDSHVVDPGRFLQDTIADLNIGYLKKDAQVAVNALINFCLKITNVHWMAQFFGLFRIWGHPWISAVEGIKKVKEIALSEKTIHPEIPKMIQLKFRETYFHSYHEKHGVYPQHHIIEDSKCYLLDCLSRGVKFDKSSSVYNIRDFSKITIDQTVSIPVSYALASLLSDKAISLGKSLLFERIKNHKSIQHPRMKRAILAWLESEYDNPIELLTKLCLEGFTAEDLFIGIKGKEREMKIAARFFAMMTLRMRLYFTMTEEMLADSIIPHIPAATMKDNQLVLTKKMLNISGGLIAGRNLRKLEGESFYTTVVFNLDFKKWNLNMRSELTDSLFTDLGCIFGLPNLYTLTHDVFKNSTVYLADGTYLPTIGPDDNLVEDAYCWRGHLGGFEGLRQKGWTIATMMLLECVCSRHSVTYKMTGQGDNQVLSVTFYHSLDSSEKFGSREKVLNELRKKKDKFWDDLVLTCEAAGLPLKPLESWESQNLYAYGKNLFFNGVMLPMTLKKLSRAFYLSNDTIATLDNSLGAISANVQTAALPDHDFVIPDLVMKVEGSLCIKRLMLSHSPMLGDNPYGPMSTGNFEWKVHLGEPYNTTVTRMLDPIYHPQSLDDFYNLIHLMLNLPRCLGGLSVCNPISIVERGFPDPLTAGLVWIMRLAEVDTKNDAIYKHWINPEHCPSVNLEMLIQDPLAVNILIPTSGCGVLNAEVEKMILSYENLNNKYFQALSHIVTPDMEEKLYNVLGSMRPFWPRLSHDMYSAVVIGHVKQAISKINSTVTMRKLAIKNSERDIMRNLSLQENRYIRSVIYRCQLPSRESFPACTASHAQKMRDESWKLKVVGVTTPHPLEMFKFEFLARDDHCVNRSGYISAIVCPEASTSTEDMLKKRGPMTPYLGSYTQSRLTAHLYEQVEGEPMLYKAFRLLQLKDWMVKSGSNLHYFLKQNVHSLTEDEDMIPEPDEVETSGAAEHRYKDESTKHGGLLGINPSLGSYCAISSDPLQEYSKGSKNVTIHFQATFCHLTNAITYELAHKQETPGGVKEIHAHVKCQECIRPVDDEQPDLTCAVSDITALFDQIKQKYPHRITKEMIMARYTDREHAMAAIISEHTPMPAESYRELVFRCLSRRMRNSFIGSSSSQYTSSFETEMFSRAWWYRLDPKRFLNRVCADLYVAKMVTHLRRDKLDVQLSETTLSQVLSDLRVKADGAYSGMNLVWYLQDHTTAVYEDYGPDLMPTSFPITELSASYASKRLLERIMLLREWTVDLAPINTILLHVSEVQIAYHVVTEELIKSIIIHPTCLVCLHYLLERVPLHWEEIHNNITFTPESIRSYVSQLQTGCACELGRWIKTITIKFNISDMDSLMRKISPWEKRLLSKRPVVRLGKMKCIGELCFGTAADYQSQYEARIQWTFSTMSSSLHFDRHWSLFTSTGQKYGDLLSEERLRGKRKIFVVGDGMGGATMIICLNSHPDTEIQFATTYSSEGVNSQTLPTAYPPYIAPFIINNPTLLDDIQSKQCGQKVHWSSENMTSPNDVTSSIFFDYWSLKFLDGIDLIVCDAEPEQYNADFFRRAMTNLLKLGSHSILIKVYLDVEGGILSLANYLSLNEWDVTIYQSPYSGCNTPEVLLLFQQISPYAGRDLSHVGYPPARIQERIHRSIMSRLSMTPMPNQTINVSAELKLAFYSGVPDSVLLMETIHLLGEHIIYPFSHKLRKYLLSRMRVKSRIAEVKLVESKGYLARKELYKWVIAQSSNVEEAKQLSTVFLKTEVVWVYHLMSPEQCVPTLITTENTISFRDIKTVNKILGRYLVLREEKLGINIEELNWELTSATTRFNIPFFFQSRQHLSCSPYLRYMKWGVVMPS